ncbi:halocyanin domain-containing protein [Halococcus sp. IIIV-5B]|uniref:halocyanin domain-containing protein n=1 Tax=Halococcus sp. IIIV-5B TaxID=2321230 RepID=UPI000E732DEA|nr:halocyanin domain-containing protein [Halococcus sp. IIIV-5B]
MDRREFLRGSLGATLSVASIGFTGCFGHSDPGQIEAYLDDTEGWDDDVTPTDNIVDKTDFDHVPITVGSGPNYHSFSPLAIEISPGTTVTWVWTGRGGRHNIKNTRTSTLTLRSGSPKQNGLFSHTFSKSGLLLYFCDRHYSENMRGAIIVTSPGSETEATE